MKLICYLFGFISAANQGKTLVTVYWSEKGRLSGVLQSKVESNRFLETPLSREKRFLKEVWIKKDPQYKRYCREDLRKLILQKCPGVGKREGFSK